jgi:predicted small integral membrane protein
MEYRCPKFLKETLDALSGDEVFVAVIGCGFINALLLWFGKLDQNIYQVITLGTVGAWIVAKSANTIAQTNADARVAQVSSTK